MTKKKSILTPEQAARVAAIQEQLKNKPTAEELVASGDFLPPITMGDYCDIASLIAELKALRIKSEKSLRDCAAAAGMDYAALSRLESGISTNPTIHTLVRYARALSKRIQFSLAEEEVAPAIPAMSSNVTQFSAHYQMAVVPFVVPNVQFIAGQRVQTACVG